METNSVDLRLNMITLTTVFNEPEKSHERRK